MPKRLRFARFGLSGRPSAARLRSSLNASMSAYGMPVSGSLHSPAPACSLCATSNPQAASLSIMLPPPGLHAYPAPVQRHTAAAYSKCFNHSITSLTCHHALLAPCKCLSSMNRRAEHVPVPLCQHPVHPPQRLLAQACEECTAPVSSGAPSDDTEGFGGRRRRLLRLQLRRRQHVCNLKQHLRTHRQRNRA